MTHKGTYWVLFCRLLNFNQYIPPQLIAPPLVKSVTNTVWRFPTLFQFDMMIHFSLRWQSLWHLRLEHVAILLYQREHSWFVTCPVDQTMYLLFGWACSFIFHGHCPAWSSRLDNDLEYFYNRFLSSLPSETLHANIMYHTFLNRNILGLKSLQQVPSNLNFPFTIPNFHIVFFVLRHAQNNTITRIARDPVRLVSVPLNYDGTVHYFWDIPLIAPFLWVCYNCPFLSYLVLQGIPMFRKKDLLTILVIQPSSFKIRKVSSPLKAPVNRKQGLIGTSIFSDSFIGFFRVK